MNRHERIYILSFQKLDKEELIRTAENDFAVALSEDEKKSKKLVLAAMAESGVTFEKYLECNPEQREKFAPVEEAPETPQNVVTSADVTEGTDEVEIVTKEERPKLAAEQKWLVKMDRKNPLFEIAGHRFTSEHPYVLMSAEDAEVVLREEGFRQAYPSEIQDYYS